MNMPVKISVITPCFNMAPYIKQTIKSVLDQDYANLEYIVIDGGSTDGSQSIIEKYRDRIAYYVSEKDDGMYDAINKGIRHSTGDIIAWINADDIYMPWTFQVVNEIFSSYSDIQWIGGKYAFLSESGMLAHVFAKCANKTQKDIRNGWCREELLGCLMQEGMFWRRNLMESSGLLNSSYKYAGDFELWTRFAQHSMLWAVDVPFAAFRRRKGGLSISQKNRYLEEVNSAIVGKKKYPNMCWRLLHGSVIFRQILRLLRYRKGHILYFNATDNSIHKKEFLSNASTQCMETLRMFFD
ncbi:MAG: glycosyltransferase [Prevotella sp.]|nr:glycosyltransferase [Candidatus Equicola stercoris]